jgi:thiamine-monophosphate kinase
MAAEFDLIRRHFRRDTGGSDGVVLGVGDDCALLAPSPGMQFAVSTDTLIEGVHFPPDTPAADVGWKALAVNLSDLAAMGAAPRACLLALSLPAADDTWTAAFAEGFFELVAAAQCPLVGGDTTALPASAPRVLTVTVLGEVPPGEALRRDGARAGDFICISGRTGEAAQGLALWQAGLRAGSDAAADAARARLLRPVPRLALGAGLRGVASACIDVSDGLLADLQHVLAASSRAASATLGAQVQLAALPLAPGLANLSLQQRREFQLAGGDDYELCFTVPPERLLALRVAAGTAGTAVTVIGTVTQDGALRCIDGDGSEWLPPRRGYQHFA